MSNTVMIVNIPSVITFGNLNYGDVFKYPAGEVLYMKIQTGHQNASSVHLGEGMVYSVPDSTEVVPVSSVCITRRK